MVESMTLKPPCPRTPVNHCVSEEKSDHRHLDTGDIICLPGRGLKDLSSIFQHIQINSTGRNGCLRTEHASIVEAFRGESSICKVAMPDARSVFYSMATSENCPIVRVDRVNFLNGVTGFVVCRNVECIVI